MASQQTNRYSGKTADNRRQQHLISGRGDSRFDYGKYHVFDNPTYVATAPAHAYSLNRAYSGRSVSQPPFEKHQKSHNDVPNKLPHKEKHKKWTRYFQLYVIIVLAIAILLCLAFGLGFGLGLRDDESDTCPSSRLHGEDPNKEPDVTISVIVEDVDWDPAMTDKCSSSFLRSADVTERSMDRYFRESSMDEIYDYAVVSDFWQGSGSVGCTARIYLKSPPTNSSQEINDIYKRVHNTSGEHLIAENLQIGQDAISPQPLTDRVRFRTSTLQIKAISTPTDGMSTSTSIGTQWTTPTSTADHIMQFTLEGGEAATYGYVKLNLDNKDGLLCITGQHTDVMATYLCRETNSTFYGGLILQADILQKPTREDVWQVDANCYRPKTDSFSDCVQSSWIFFHNVTIYSKSMNNPDEQQPLMSDSMQCPLNNTTESTTESPNKTPESSVSEMCLMKIYCHTQPVDIYQEPNSNSGYIIATNMSDPKVFCRDNFTDLEATAACKTLGYTKGGASLTFNPVPWFNSRIWTYASYGYKCSENATIYSCSRTEIDVTRQCSGPAVIKCLTDAVTETEWDIQLDSDGNTVLLYYKGQWGTICDGGTKHPWTSREATVVCKRLNYTHGVPTSVKYIPAIPLPHVITNVICSDSQAKLADCTYSEVKDDSCITSYAATVFCYNSTDVANLDFVSGSEFNSGFVEVTREGKVGYLCTSSLPSKAANVICRSLGFVSGVQDTYANFTDPHLQYIWQTDFKGQCTEDDVLAETCRSAAWVLHAANMSQADRKCVCNDNYVALYCYGKVKFSLEPRKNYGPLLIYGDSGYNLLCNEDVNQDTATAACREITRLSTSHAVILPLGTFDKAASAKNAVFNCTKDAISVSDCVTFSTGFNFNCKDTSVLCYNGTEIPGTIPKNATEWRIEDSVVQVKAYGIFGIVCSEGWSNTEATVLCKTLNSENTVGISQEGNSLPTVPMWISQVKCDANATNINMCSRTTLSESSDYCMFGGVAQTFCFKGENDVPKFILADVEETTYHMKGHLAVTRSNQTGHMCFQDNSEIKSNVDAVCRLMGYYGGQLSHSTISRNDVTLIWNGSFYCNWSTPDCFLNGKFMQRKDLNYTGSFTASDVKESENSTSSIFRNPCGDLHTLSVLCFSSKVRLEDPESPEGFLLINGTNGWQALCSENFTLELAERFCTGAGYLSGNFTARSALDAHLTAGFADVTCNNVSRFEDCTFNEIPSEVSNTCNDAVYIYCTESLNITMGSH